MKALIRFEASLSPNGSFWMDITEEYEKANRKKTIYDFDDFIKKSKYVLGRVKYTTY